MEMRWNGPQLRIIIERIVFGWKKINTLIKEKKNVPRLVSSKRVTKH